MMTDTATELKHTKTNGPHWEKFEAISLNPTATMCAASGRRPDGQRPQISIYDPIKGKHLHSIDGLSGDVLALCFISEQILCVGQSSGDLGLWQIDEQRVQVLTTIKLSHSAVTTLAYDNLGQSLYVGCEDGLLRAISFGDWSEREVNFEWPNDVAIRALAVDINGDWIAAAGDDGVIRVYSTSKGGEPYRVMPGHEGAVRALVLHPREYRLISSGDDRSIRMWYLQGEIEFQDRAAKQEHSKAITCMVLGPVFLDDNGDEIPPRLLTGSEDGTVKIWPLATQRQPKTIEIGKSAVTSIAMTKQRDGAILVAANSSRVIAGYTFNKQTEPVGEHLTLFSEFHDLRYRLRSKKLKERVESLEKLASKIEDPGVFEAILGAMREDQEPDVRAAAVLYLAQTKYRRPIKELREALNDGHAKVRSAALDGLRQLQGADALAPLASALQSNYEDTRCLSIKELVALRERTPNVVRLVRQALQDRAKSVQIAALDALEQIYPSTAQHPDNTALLLALRENNPELQLEVLYRIHRYQWARLPEFQAHLTQLMDHEYVNIRQTTFQLLIASIPQLVEAVRPLDEVLDRQLAELDEVIVGTRSATSKDTAKKAAGADKSRKKAPRSADQANLDDWCKQPLYLGQSSRHADIVLRATSLLAKLQDLRAFGTLLQLSQSTEADTRRDTAFALRDLADPRAMICLTQLMNDASKEVRDIAFDSFDVLATEPLQLARTALSCIHPDLRHRALQKLMGEQKKSPSTDAIELLTYALGDSDASVRNEAFKILWNLLADEPQRCLLLALSSQNPDMRKKAIDEMSAAFGVQSWAQDAILGALHDPNTEVHNRAYDVLEKILPKSELTLIRRALQTDHKSLRIKALQQLSKAKKADQRPLLLEILAENERELRQLALDILIDKFAKDQDTLADALKISHWDVRLKVAQHLAALGNARVLEVAADYLREETQRLDEFVRYYQCPPHQNILDVLPDKEKAQLREYRKAIISIVEQLGVADGINYIQPFVDDPDSEVAIQAVRAISLCADITHGELVSRFLDFRLKQVRAYAIEGLARLGQSSVLNEVQALLSGSNREEQRRAVIALHALAEVGRPHTRQLLNHGQLYVRHDAWSILLAHEYQMASRGEMPSDLLYAISSKYAEIRLEAAHILQHRTKREAFLQTILDVFCGFYNFEATPKGQNLRNELVQHLPAWFESLNSEQAPQRHAAASLLFVRHDVEEFLATLKRRLKQWSKTKAEPISAVDQVLEHSSEYQELAFGTYIGLLRQANSTDIQIKALQGIVSLDRTYFPTLMLQSVFEQAILHPDSSEVRKAALQLFHALDPADHAHTYIMAIASPHPDIGLAALQMIAAEASEVARLWTTRALQSAVREVRHKAAEQLQNLYPDHSLEPFILILQSEYTDVRLRVIDRLLRTEDARVTEALTQALSSDHWELRLKAAEVLAERKVVSAYEVLVEFLNSEDHAMQKRAALSLVVLGDPRAVAALTARFDDDPEQTANKSLLLQSLGELALDLAADWLVQKLDYPDIQITQQAFGALLGLAVSDGKPDIERLVRYLERALQSKTGDIQVRAIERLEKLEHADISRLLQPLLWHRDQQIRRRAVDAIASRIPKLDLDCSPLKALLEHRDPYIRLESAIVLGKQGYSEAFPILFGVFQTSMDIQEQRRAIDALGVLGDQRAFESLLSLFTASDDVHPALDAAAEAIGRLTPDNRRADIQRMLLAIIETAPPPSGEILISGELLPKLDLNTRSRAIIGLRWLVQREAVTLLTQIVRKGIDHWPWQMRCELAKQFGEIGDPIAENTLASMLKDDYYDVKQAAAEALLKLYGKEHPRPNLLILDCEDLSYYFEELKENAAKMVAQHASVAEILERLPLLSTPSTQADLFLDIPDTVAHESDEAEPEIERKWAVILEQGLLRRQPLPIEHVLDALQHQKPYVRINAIHTLMRMLPEDLTLVSTDLHQKIAKSLEQATLSALKLWQGSEHNPARIAQFWQLALWAQSQIVPQDGERAALETLRVANAPAIARAQAVYTLGVAKLFKPQILEALYDALKDAQEKVRRLSSWALGQLQFAELQISCEQLPQIPSATQHLIRSANASQIAQLLAAPLANRDIIPSLIASRNSALLIEMFQQSPAQTARQLLAIDALGRIADPASIAQLDIWRQDEQIAPELRIAAYRAWRRAKRLEIKANSSFAQGIS